MAGSAVLLLVQRGKVKVEDDVRKHLPEIPVYSADHPITIDHLSRHTSGLPDYLSWEGAEVATKRGYLTNADAVALVVLPGIMRTQPKRLRSASRQGEDLTGAQARCGTQQGCCR